MLGKFVALVGLLSFAKQAVRAESFSECQSVPPGSFVNNEKNCQAYIYCNGVTSYTHLCPDGTYFDADKLSCALAENVYCKHHPMSPEVTAQYVVEQTSAELAPTQPESFAATSTYLRRPECPPDTDEYFPYPLRCEYYYRCSKGFLFVMNCNPKHAWDYRQKACVPTSQAVCFHYKSV